MVSVDTLPDTPVMRQYQDIKARHPKSLVFFRLGDFYEMFGDDARAASSILGLMLTQRQGVAMCGVPYHSSQSYIARLLRAGKTIAIADQLEAPSKDKKLVARDVIRVVTPGTLVEDELLEPGGTNALVAVNIETSGWGAACLDISTGESWATQAQGDRGHRRLHDLLARLRPVEVIASSQTSQELDLAAVLSSKACLTLREENTPASPPLWSSRLPWREKPLALKAALAARSYVDESKFRLIELPEPAYREPEGVLLLDDTAIRTLEIIESADGDKRHTLWGQLDFSRTPMGSRQLKHWLLQPSTDVNEIRRRQDQVEDLLSDNIARRRLGDSLKEISDLPRAVCRLSTRSAGPRDLGALRRTLSQLPTLTTALAQFGFRAGLSAIATALAAPSEELKSLATELANALADELPARLSDGGLIRSGYNAELDEVRQLKNNSDAVLSELESRERAATGIPTLKAGYNSVFGYFLEISKGQSAKAPAHYQRKQTLTNAERYITPELKEIEARILTAEDKIVRLEAALFEQLRKRCLADYAHLMSIATVLAELDATLALADAAVAHHLVKPIVDETHDLEIVDGRHPVLAALLASGEFVANSLTLNARDPQIVILTGPNMSGKSTYLRQNALIALMAQAGSFVPARSARVGIVDKILTRIGAQDALARGDSTFMVEMKETSHILRSATTRSLVILDEVGRGTSTFDGISIAWAVIEHLHAAYESKKDGARGPRTLFATHYFELTALAGTRAGIINANVDVKEWKNPEGRTEVVFLHKIAEGPADRSYGIHVAALAGLPATLVARAGQILHDLETQSPPLKTTVVPKKPDAEKHAVLRALEALDLDSLTPLEALQTLNVLKKQI